MSNTTAIALLQQLLQHPSLQTNLQFYHIQRFFELTTRLWLEIVPPNKARPAILPLPIAAFLSSVLDLDPALIQLTWTTFSDLAQEAILNSNSLLMDDNFKQHGHEYKLGMTVASGSVAD
ncbi:hypothetical protein C8R46DRAFT_1233011 [Mycena filopes]|nr:hypothetical protein C8R46DRAFT_1233011 [Mycena filopes]